MRKTKDYAYYKAKYKVNLVAVEITETERQRRLYEFANTLLKNNARAQTILESLSLDSSLL
jgi:hypothetical protein